MSYKTVGIADPDNVFGGPPDAETMAQDLATTYDRAELTRITQLLVARLLPGEGEFTDEAQAFAEAYMTGVPPDPPLPSPDDAAAESTDIMSDNTTPVAIAIDIDGELAGLEKALIVAELALLMARRLEHSRWEAEEREHERHDGWLSRSSRHKKLSYAVDELRRGVELLGRAMRAPTTIDDEIPF
jgi:hypothetical protein